MNRQVLVVIGSPGAGKSTLLRHAVGDGAESLHEVPTVTYPSGLVQLGAIRDRGYPGADVLGLAELPAAFRWVCSDAAPLRLIIEGVNAVTEQYLRQLAAAGWQIAAIYLDVPQAVMRERRLTRGYPEHTGERWYQQQWQHARDLAEVLIPRAWRLDGRLPPTVLAARLRQHPVLQGRT